MITLNQTAGDDNDVIFVFQFYLDNGTAYLATKSITLGSNSYDGAVFLYPSINKTNANSDFSLGGGLSSHDSLSIDIANSIDNTYFSDFFDSFYPNNTNYLVNRKVNVGFVWSNATLESQITWFASFYISNYSYDTALHLELLNYSDLDNMQLPRFELQDKLDDNISYAPYRVSSQFLGTPIPIVYGDFTFPAYAQANSTDYGWVKPEFDYGGAYICALGDWNYTLIAASHKIKEFTQTDYLFNLNHYDSTTVIYGTTNNNTGSDTSIGVYVPDLYQTVLVNPVDDAVSPSLYQKSYNNVAKSYILFRPDSTPNNVNLISEMSFPFSYGYLKTSSSVATELSDEELEYLRDNDITDNYITVLQDMWLELSREKEYSDDLSDILQYIGDFYLIITVKNTNVTDDGAFSILSYDNTSTLIRDSGVDEDAPCVVHAGSTSTFVVNSYIQKDATWSDIFNRRTRIYNVETGYPYGTGTKADLQILQCYYVSANMIITRMPGRINRNRFATRDRLY